jgi:hypothetical protein
MDDGVFSAGKSRPTGSNRHRVGGPRLQSGVDGIRAYFTECECGWVSEQCASAVLAEADGEQHRTMSARRTPRLDAPSAN